MKYFENGRLLLLAGPCVVESRDNVFRIAEGLKKLTENRPVDFVFKASYDKANRTSASSFRGPGMSEGLEILRTIAERSAHWSGPDGKTQAVVPRLR